MQIAVIGAGVVGVCTAYELAAQGSEVSVFERRNSVAEEASFAHGGLMTPGYVAAWAEPDAPWPWTAGPRRLRLAGLTGSQSLRQLPWLWQRWRARRPRAGTAFPSGHPGRTALHALATRSLQRTRELVATLRLDVQQTEGCLVLLRSAADWRRSDSMRRQLDSLGVAHELLDAAQARDLEPGLNPLMALYKAIHLPADGGGNCRQFTQALRAEAQALGVRFHFDSPVLGLQTDTATARPLLRLREGETQAFDAVVLCTGGDSTGLLRSAGVRLPMMPVLGCSVTAPLRLLDGHPQPGPRSAVIDARTRFTLCRLGLRVRASGQAVLGTAPARPAQALLADLYRALDDWFPGAVQWREAQPWQASRFCLPDGLPVLGASGRPGLWLNLAHGGSGWALACGSAQVLAEQLAGRAAAVDVLPLSAQRFG